jgi:hypothetical protein
MTALNWSDCNGAAELEHAKQQAKATLSHMLEYHGDLSWEDYPEGNREIVIACVMVLRDELVAWARET